jgi:hypothetical protein
MPGGGTMTKQMQYNEPHLVLGTSGEGYPLVLTGELFQERHKHIMGTSGSGKSYACAGYIAELFAQQESICLLDPHGDLARTVLSLFAETGYFDNPQAFERLWYVDFNRIEKATGAYEAAVAFNVLAQPYPTHTIASNLLEAMHRAFPVSTTTANLDNIIQMACQVLIENKRPFTDINKLILDRDFRDQLLENVTDELVKQFFQLKFSGEKVSASLVDSTLKRTYLMTFSPQLRFPLMQRKNTLNFRSLMDHKISLICNLSGLDDQTRRLLGGLIMVGLEQAFLSRANQPRELRHRMHVFADEFQIWMSSSEVSFSTFMDQCRKYGAVVYCIHQTLGQLPAGIENSLQNCISLVLRAGYLDSNKLTSNFYRPQAPKHVGFFEALLQLFEGTPQQARAFDLVATKDDARAVFENLQRMEALVTMNGTTTRIWTPTIPKLHVDPAYLSWIEDEYARRLLTPVSEINRLQTLDAAAQQTNVRKKNILSFPTAEEQEDRKQTRAKRRVE